MSVLTEALMILGAIATFILLLVGIVNWLSSGFWSTWLKVRLSKGKRWLVRVWTPTSTYYTSAKVDGEQLQFKDKNKNSRKIVAQEGTMYKSFGVTCVEIDEVTNGVRVTEGDKEAMPDNAVRVKGAFHVVPGFDAVTLDSMVQRAYELGRSAKNNKEKLIFLMLLIVLGLSAFSVYMTYVQGDQIVQIINSINQGPVI